MRQYDRARYFDSASVDSSEFFDLLVEEFVKDPPAPSELADAIEDHPDGALLAAAAAEADRQRPTWRATQRWLASQEWRWGTWRARDAAVASRSLVAAALEDARRLCPIDPAPVL